MSFLRIQNLYKTFGQVTAVNRINLDIAEGEFFTLLGSSGCGKTTTFRCIAGLENPDGGEIRLGDQLSGGAGKGVIHQTEEARYRHGVPVLCHLATYDGVQKCRLSAQAARRQRRRGATAGQGSALLGRQVVWQIGRHRSSAVASSSGSRWHGPWCSRRRCFFSTSRSAISTPSSAKDRREIKSLQQRVHITVIFVTHDQVEALGMSDRIAMMKFGVLEQVGTPEDVYYRPATPFVRDFLGKTFLLPGKITESAAQTINVEVQGSSTASLQLPRSKVIGAANGSLSVGQGVTVAIRPEKVNLTGSRQDGRVNMVEATLQTLQFLGYCYEYTVTLGADTRVLVSPESYDLKSGDRVHQLKPEGMTLWPLA